MGKTPIEWSDYSWSPLRARVRKDAVRIAQAKGYTSLVPIAAKMIGHVGPHCERVSHGCDHCYSETNNSRCLPANGTGLPFDRRARDLVEPFVDEHILEQPLHWKAPRRVFVNSQTDLFGEWVSDEAIDRVFAVMALCPQHQFQVLTKRPERMLNWMTDTDTPFRVARAMDSISASHKLGDEEVRQIAGYPGYFASSHGLIYSDKRGKRRTMKPDAGEQGHLRVQLHREGKTSKRGDRFLVHHLILETFVGPQPYKASQGCHGDGNPGNNAVSNLAWGTQEDNWEDRKRHGHHRSYSKLDQEQVAEIKRRYLAGESGESISRIFSVSATQIRNITSGKQWANELPIAWPLYQCWLGVSCEDQATADERIPLLLRTPAAVRFVSYEPALGPVDFLTYLGSRCPECGAQYVKAGWNDCIEPDCDGRPRKLTDWIIVGGESGPGARPFDIAWARNTVAQCKAAGVPVFCKQIGSNPYYAGYELGRADRHDRKGGDMEYWPIDLRVRQFPEVKG